MGKRSAFARVERDLYPTPLKAVLPLLPHLRAGTSYCEPCAGRGDLVSHLDFGRYTCTLASDVVPAGPGIKPMDALDLTPDDVAEVDFIITNPPWSRPVLHHMIEHFTSLRPTWLLIDADWFHTRQAARFMPWLVKYVSVGRVKWIPDSEMSGKDNAAWYLFDRDNREPCRAFGRDGGGQC